MPDSTLPILGSKQELLKVKGSEVRLFEGFSGSRLRQVSPVDGSAKEYEASLLRKAPLRW